jgi:hypothetical protein
MMDLRYHLASLMSIFLALAVGIVVGVSLGSSERQAATIRVLQQDVAAIRSEDTRLKEMNNDLQRRLTRQEEAAQEGLLPLAVRGRLAGNHVAIVWVRDPSEALLAPISRALRLAAADVLIIRLPHAETSPDDPSPPLVHGSTGDSRAASTDKAPNVLEEGAAGTLARALLTGRPALLDEVRARVASLEVTGELRSPIRRLLLVCPNDQSVYARRAMEGRGQEVAFARTAKEGGAILVAAEPESTASQGRATAAVGAADREATSLLPALAALGASTVDHVDTTMGQIAAVLALAGAQGNYGTGPGATQVLPPLQEREEHRAAQRPSLPATHR